jgi:hypothetical protein
MRAPSGKKQKAADNSDVGSFQDMWPVAAITRQTPAQGRGILCAVASSLYIEIASPAWQATFAAPDAYNPTMMSGRKCAR